MSTEWRDELLDAYKFFRDRYLDQVRRTAEDDTTANLFQILLEYGRWDGVRGILDMFEIEPADQERVDQIQKELYDAITRQFKSHSNADVSASVHAGEPPRGVRFPGPAGGHG